MSARPDTATTAASASQPIRRDIPTRSRARSRARRRAQRQARRLAVRWAQSSVGLSAPQQVLSAELSICWHRPPRRDAPTATPFTTVPAIQHGNRSRAAIGCYAVRLCPCQRPVRQALTYACPSGCPAVSLEGAAWSGGILSSVVRCLPGDDHAGKPEVGSDLSGEQASWKPSTFHNQLQLQAATVSVATSKVVHAGGVAAGNLDLFLVRY